MRDYNDFVTYTGKASELRLSYIGKTIDGVVADSNKTDFDYKLFGGKCKTHKKLF